MILGRLNGCSGEHREGEGEGAAARRDPSRNQDPAAGDHQQGVREKMAGVMLVFNSRLSTRDGVEHMGPHSKLSQAGFPVLLYRHCCFSHLGTCGFHPVAPVCVADGQERLVVVFIGWQDKKIHQDVSLNYGLYLAKHCCELNPVLIVDLILLAV